MSWLELIGKVLFFGFVTVAVIAIALIMLVMIWLAWEQAHGRNPFR